MCFEAGSVELDFGKNVPTNFVTTVGVLIEHVHPIVDLSLVVELS